MAHPQQTGGEEAQNPGSRSSGSQGSRGGRGQANEGALSDNGSDDGRDKPAPADSTPARCCARGRGRGKRKHPLVLVPGPLPKSLGLFQHQLHSRVLLVRECSTG